MSGRTILDEHLAMLDGQLGGGWLGRLEFRIVESPYLAPDTMIVVDPTLLTVTVPSVAEFRAALDWSNLDLDVRAIFNRSLRRLADRWGVATSGIARRRVR